MLCPDWACWGEETREYTRTRKGFPSLSFRREGDGPGYEGEVKQIPPGGLAWGSSGLEVRWLHFILSYIRTQLNWARAPARVFRSCVVRSRRGQSLDQVGGVAAPGPLRCLVHRLGRAGRWSTRELRPSLLRQGQPHRIQRTGEPQRGFATSPNGMSLAISNGMICANTCRIPLSRLPLTSPQT